MTTSRFLMGRGELLTFQVDPPKRRMDKKSIYTLEEAKERLIPEIINATEVFKKLPDSACPSDIVVAKIILHPAYIAKSFYPSIFFREADLIPIGSRTVRVKPQRLHRKKAPEVCETTEIYVAGKRKTFSQLPNYVSTLNCDAREAKEFCQLEHIAALTSEDRLKNTSHYNGKYYEIGIHLIPGASNIIRQPFFNFANELGFKVYEDLQFRAGQLLFLPVKGSADKINELANFSLVRVIRPIPKLRGTRPIARGPGVSIKFELPLEQPLSSEPRVAILDGGLPAKHILSPWVRRQFKSDESAKDVDDYVNHGLWVTSSFLFGPIEPNKQAQRPFAYVDHHRVLDTKSNGEEPLDLYRTLGHIEEILMARQYEFVNLSLGPDLPIEDTDVHAWTSVIDDLLSDGETLLTVAAGNNGENDRASGNARIQVPSDCVNALTVGAADRTGAVWNRASYSAIGPGRIPGRRKPDLVAFGGSPNQYFHVATLSNKPELAPLLGTSFAAPFLLRTGVGIRAILGVSLSPLAIKALLIHTSHDSEYHPDEVGWGKASEDINWIITCHEGMARIVFQGELKPGKYLRAPIPLPKNPISGKVKITATFCYASPVDPQDASAYTKAGLVVTFRPNASRFAPKALHPKSRSFFQQSEFLTEAELRSDLGKWETALHATQSMLGSSLNDASFDIHYSARDSGMVTTGASKIRYALIITLETPKHAKIYDEILAAHKVLIQLQPQLAVPIQI